MEHSPQAALSAKVCLENTKIVLAIYLMIQSPTDIDPEPIHLASPVLVRSRSLVTFLLDDSRRVSVPVLFGERVRRSVLVTITGGFGDYDGCDGRGDHEALELRAGRSSRGNRNHIDSVNVRDGRQR
jgi:hypothetical protein